MRKCIFIAVIGAAILSHAAVGSEERLPNPLEKAASDVIAANLNYRAALERVLIMYERDLRRRTEGAELRADLYERGVLSRQEWAESQEALARAGKNVEETRLAIAEADRMLGEARIAETLARQSPLAPGSYQELPGLVRFNGTGPWSVTTDTAGLQQFFLGRFGRSLPISASGQSPLHAQIGFDHRNALDVAVHPDSVEGRALMAHLRARGIPFIAAWGAIPGSSSGAHLHVGQPSPRIANRGRVPTIR